MAVGRFAPSPTGPLHVGNLRTALLAWLFARSAGSAFVMRVEDLDRTASRPEIERQQLADLAALGLDHDGPVVHQSERFDLYHEAIDRLTAEGRTYPCYCTRREVVAAASAPHDHLPDGAYPGTCRALDIAGRAAHEAAGRTAALRLCADGVSRAFVDRVHGPTAAVVDDLVLRRSDGTPAYNLAVVVDDAAQGVEEVVRGDDLLLGTPRQVLVGELLGLPIPRYAHVPLVLGPDGRRLAKRHGSVTLTALATGGRTPTDVLAAMAAGLGLGGPDEPVTPRLLLTRFDPAAVPVEPWVFDATRAWETMTR